MRRGIPLVLSIAAAMAVATSGTGAQVFRGAVDMVTVDVKVTKSGKPVSGLKAEDFELSDNRVKQTLRDATYETLPIDVTLAIDTSGSVKGYMLDQLKRAVDLVRQRLREADRLSVLTFNDRARERVGFSAAEAKAPIDLGDAIGPTALNDAIVLALAAPPPSGRRQLVVVFTDGLDTVSFLDHDAVLDVAKRSGSSVFVVTQQYFGLTPPKFFADLAETTGGQLQFVQPFSVIVDGQQRSGVLNDAFLKAIDDFRSSYVLRYTLAGTKREGWHDIDVKVVKGGGYQVRAKKGYVGR